MEFTLIAISVSINIFLTLSADTNFLFPMLDIISVSETIKKISDYRQTDKRQQDYLHTDVRSRDKNQFLNDIYRAYHAQH
jgi:hypothetical protein